MGSHSSFMPMDNEPDPPYDNGYAQPQFQSTAFQSGLGYGAVQQAQANSGESDSKGMSKSSVLIQDPLHIGYSTIPASGSSDNLDIYGTQDGFVPSLRGGEDDTEHTGSSAMGGGWWADTTPISTNTGVGNGRGACSKSTVARKIDLVRASLLAAGPSEHDPNRDLYDPPPPGQTTSSRTGANRFPVGTRRRAFQEEHRGWDFNSNEPMPGTRDRSVYAPCFQVREFSKCNDESLLGYLSARKVSTGFLVEIDQFIRGYPELAKHACGMRFLEELTNLPPLEAYQYFLRGYTRPARYIDGIMLTGDFRLPLDFRPRSVSHVKDKELEDFFDGFEYRYDILDQIDRVVSAACVDLSHGRFVSSGLRRLVCYAAWGNPVDAYKWYEYSYQQDYMPHRYLPEHVVLGEIPKPDGYIEPEPTIMKGWRRHREVRFRMAKAKDEGIDVIDVLLSEYRTALVRKSYRRVDIDSLCATAKRRLDDERQYPRGVDIVDMIMDDAVRRVSTKPSSTFHSVAPRRAARPSTVRSSIPVQSRSGRKARRGNVGNTTGVAAYSRTQSSDLREAKVVLDRLYLQGAQACTSSYNYGQDLSAIASSRATAERRYVNELIRYLRGTKRMSTIQASELQRCFTRDRMARAGNGSNRDYLLALYPHELK